VCKNIGTTHITNGCYRLHPVEWNIGEAAGSLAAHCLDHRLEAEQVYEDAELPSRFQDELTHAGVELALSASLERGDPHRGGAAH
jgi:hypothetical protein